MLRLLAQREEGYEDIAALMGIGVDEVRARVREALKELSEGAPAAGPVAAGGPPPPAVAEASSGAVPPATPPAEEAAKPVPPPAAAPLERDRAGRGEADAERPASRQPRTAPRLSLPKERRRLFELVGGGLVVLLIVLFATGAIDIGGGDSKSSSNATTASEAPPENESTTAAGSKNLTQAVLAPVDGGDASGQALFGRFKKNVLLQVTAEGLDPSASGESYAVWLARSAKAMVPVGTAKVDASGKLVARFPVPAAVLVLLARGAFDEIALTQTSDASLSAAIARAKKKGQEPAYTGTDVLRGKVTGPFVKG
jgi:hypothetical protein